MGADVVDSSVAVVNDGIVVANADVDSDEPWLTSVSFSRAAQVDVNSNKIESIAFLISVSRASLASCQIGRAHV